MISSGRIIIDWVWWKNWECCWNTLKINVLYVYFISVDQNLIYTVINCKIISILYESIDKFNSFLELNQTLLSNQLNSYLRIKYFLQVCFIFPF
jgi:hypothetical protein